MIQRSSTHVARSDTLMELALGGLYSEAAVKAGITTDMADLIFASMPYKILPPLQIPVYEEMKERDADFYERLEKAGFLLDFGDDGSGLFMKYLRRGSGYYIDVGASRTDRRRQDQAEERRRRSSAITEHGVVLQRRQRACRPT